MLTNNQSESDVKICQPDPEEELQRARKRKEEIEKVILSIREVKDAPIDLSHDQRESLCGIIGSMYVSVWKCDDQINRWLAEIDKN